MTTTREAATTTLSSADLGGLRIQLLADAGAALLVFLVATTLSVYKTRGRTRYGRKQDTEALDPDSNDDTGVRPGRGATTGTPRRVYVFGIIVIVLVLLFLIKHLAAGDLARHTTL